MIVLKELKGSMRSKYGKCVMLNGIVSNTKEITCGVPQGGLLAPLLYLCYNNDMELSVKSKFFLFADDSVLIVSDRNPNIVSPKLKSDLESCNQ